MQVYQQFLLVIVLFISQVQLQRRQQPNSTESVSDTPSPSGLPNNQTNNESESPSTEPSTTTTSTEPTTSQPPDMSEQEFEEKKNMLKQLIRNICSMTNGRSQCQNSLNDCVTKRDKRESRVGAYSKIRACFNILSRKILPRGLCTGVLKDQLPRCRLIIWDCLQDDKPNQCMKSELDELSEFVKDFAKMRNCKDDKALGYLGNLERQITLYCSILRNVRNCRAHFYTACRTKIGNKYQLDCFEWNERVKCIEDEYNFLLQGYKRRGEE